MGAHFSHLWSGNLLRFFLRFGGFDLLDDFQLVTERDAHHLEMLVLQFRDGFEVFHTVVNEGLHVFGESQLFEEGDDLRVIFELRQVDFGRFLRHLRGWSGLFSCLFGCSCDSSILLLDHLLLLRWKLSIGYNGLLLTSSPSEPCLLDVGLLYMSSVLLNLR